MIIKGKEYTLEELIELRELIEKAVNHLEDADAVKGVTLFPAWAVGVDYEVGDKVQNGGILYRCVQAHTSQEAWAIDETPALWVAINETNAGSLEDPIPAVAGMEYKKDLYYIYNDVIYRCIRQDTESGTVLQFTPDQLVGNYFEVV